MLQTLTIARRELTALFYSPIAYAVLALFSIGVSLLFFISFVPGARAEMRPTFEMVIWLMIFLVPALSMRLLSEEYQSGMIEALMTSPVSDAQVILGKWLGALGFFGVLLVPVLILVAILEMNADPELGSIATGLIGLVLTGALYLAIGTFASSATKNQIIAFLFTVFIISLFTIVMRYLPQAEFVGPKLRAAVYFLNIENQVADFNKGIIDVSNFLFFATGIILFLFLATIVLQSRRWR